MYVNLKTSPVSILESTLKKTQTTATAQHDLWKNRISLKNYPVEILSESVSMDCGLEYIPVDGGLDSLLNTKVYYVCPISIIEISGRCPFTNVDIWKTMEWHGGFQLNKMQRSF